MSLCRSPSLLLSLSLPPSLLQPLTHWSPRGYGLFLQEIETEIASGVNDGSAPVTLWAATSHQRGEVGERKVSACRNRRTVITDAASWWYSCFFFLFFFFLRQWWQQCVFFAGGPDMCHLSIACRDIAWQWLSVLWTWLSGKQQEGVFITWHIDGSSNRDGGALKGLLSLTGLLSFHLFPVSSFLLLWLMTVISVDDAMRYGEKFEFVWTQHNPLMAYRLVLRYTDSLEYWKLTSPILFVTLVFDLVVVTDGPRVGKVTCFLFDQLGEDMMWLSYSSLSFMNSVCLLWGSLLHKGFMAFRHVFHEGSLWEKCVYNIHILHSCQPSKTVCHTFVNFV